MASEGETAEPKETRGAVALASEALSSGLWAKWMESPVSLSLQQMSAAWASTSKLIHNQRRIVDQLDKYAPTTSALCE